jgi:hypothetical protein
MNFTSEQQIALEYLNSLNISDRSDCINLIEQTDFVNEIILIIEEILKINLEEDKSIILRSLSILSSIFVKIRILFFSEENNSIMKIFQNFNGVDCLHIIFDNLISLIHSEYSYSISSFSVPYS